MRTAVVRVNVDPDNALAPAQLTDGMAVLLEQVGQWVAMSSRRISRLCPPAGARWSC